MIQPIQRAKREYVVCHAGLRIISNLDEVAFIQNLVFYIEAAYKVAVSRMFRVLTVNLERCSMS